MALRSFFNALGRTKTHREEDPLEGKTKLARVLTLLDLTALGVGSTLGLGVYVLAGAVAKTVAGPAVCLSFLVAAVASAFAGVCYAEFAARVPKAGSAYIYSYVSVGEFIAFTIGWNLILEYVIGTAGVAKGMSNYIDALTNNTMRDFFTHTMPIHVSFLAEYPDFFAFLLVALLTALLAFGVKESTTMNNIFTVMNLLTVVVVVVAGSIKADIKNWYITEDEIPAEYKPVAGSGGFLPFGMAGVMAGASKCFFGFVGFDCVATTGEEAINPKKNIPRSIIISLVIIFTAYFSISTVLTLMWPYYLQDADAPFPHVFEMVHMYVIKWVVTIGAIAALSTTLLGALFPLPRVLYAMGLDGVLFRFLAVVNPRTLTPLIATVISGLFAGVMASVFNLSQLIDMMSIGTLMAYTMVAISVLVLRYQEDENGKYVSPTGQDNFYNESLWTVFKQSWNLNGIKRPTVLSYAITKVTILCFFVIAIVLCVCLNFSTGPAWTVTVTLFGILLLLCFIVIFRQPMQEVELTFKVPFVPLLPCVSIFMNMYLMAQLDTATWVRFIIWLVIGYLIYFTYGIKNSLEGAYRKECDKAASEFRNAAKSGAPGALPDYSYSAENENRGEPDTKQMTKF